MKRKSQKRSQNRTLPVVLIVAGVMLILGVILVKALQAPTTSAQQGSNLNIPFPNIERVSLTDAKAAFDNGNAVFLDVRDPGSFGVQRIAGAVNIPLGELESRVGELNQAEWIIPYCT